MRLIAKIEARYRQWRIARMYKHACKIRRKIKHFRMMRKLHRMSSMTRIMTRKLEGWSMSNTDFCKHLLVKHVCGFAIHFCGNPDAHEGKKYSDNLMAIKKNRCDDCDKKAAKDE